MKRISVQLSTVENELLKEIMKEKNMRISEVMRASLWYFYSYQLVLEEIIRDTVREEMNKN